MHIKQSVCYRWFKPDDMSLEAFFRVLAEIGYAAVEIGGRGDDFEEVVDKVFFSFA